MAVELYKYAAVDPTTGDNDSANLASPNDANNIVRGKWWINTGVSPKRYFVCEASSGSALWRQIDAISIAATPSVNGYMTAAYAALLTTIAGGFKAFRTVTGNDTAVVADAGALVYVDSTSPSNLTLPPSVAAGGSSAWVAGMTLTWFNLNTGSPTFVGGTNVTPKAEGGKSLVMLAGPSSSFYIVQALYKGFDSGTGKDIWLIYGGLV